MGAIDEDRKWYINDEQKIRIALSVRALSVMYDDMLVFNVKSESTFINKVFANYKLEAKSSRCLYMQYYRHKLEEDFGDLKLDDESKNQMMERLMNMEESRLEKKLEEYNTKKTNY